MPVASDANEPPPAIVVLGMSAGGLPALQTIVRDLPTRVTGAVVIASHVAGCSMLPELFRVWTGHECRFASPGEPLRRGVFYVAPAGHHVVIQPDATLGVPRRERVRFVRPSVDWLFESAAASFGDRAIAVVLSGANDDGAHGARCIARAGGAVIVQEPASCDHPQMPLAAIATGVALRRLAPPAIATALAGELARIQEGSCRSWYPFDGGIGASAA